MEELAVLLLLRVDCNVLRRCDELEEAVDGRICGFFLDAGVALLFLRLRGAVLPWIADCGRLRAEVGLERRADLTARMLFGD